MVGRHGWGSGGKMWFHWWYGVVISCAWGWVGVVVTCVSGCAGSTQSQSAGVVAVFISVVHGAPEFIVLFSSAVYCVVTFTSAG